MEMKYKATLYGNWTKGSVGGFNFCVKHFENGSQYGIDNGCISKLEMREGDVFSLYGKIVANYDRGWDIPVSPNAHDAYKQIIAEFN